MAISKPFGTAGNRPPANIYGSGIEPRDQTELESQLMTALYTRAFEIDSVAKAKGEDQPILVDELRNLASKIGRTIDLRAYVNDESSNFYALAEAGSSPDSDVDYSEFAGIVESTYHKALHEVAERTVGGIDAIL